MSNKRLVNIGLFLSNAMEEGIRIDSCDEWNTDSMDDFGEKYPLSNSCGQYGRSMDEECQEMEPFQCALDKTMEITAVDGNIDTNIPPFTCRARIFDGVKEIFPGYYDAADDVVIQSKYIFFIPSPYPFPILLAYIVFRLFLNSSAAYANRVSIFYCVHASFFSSLLLAYIVLHLLLNSSAGKVRYRRLLLLGQGSDDDSRQVSN